MKYDIEAPGFVDARPASKKSVMMLAEKLYELHQSECKKDTPAELAGDEGVWWEYLNVLDELAFYLEMNAS